MDWWCVAGITGAAIGIPIAIVLLIKLYSRCTIGWCRSQNRLDGKVVIVTGSNSGIGKETARVIAARGAKLIMACRNMQKAEEVAQEIRTQHPGSQIIVKNLDLCSLKSVRTFADEILKDESKIDILINNAGLAGGKFRLTEDGFEEIYQANYLGPFYLTELLLPLLKKSAPARIINTGSSAYFLGSVNINKFAEDVKKQSRISMFRYGDTKLAMLMWTKGLHEELKDSKVTVNVVHPGVVATPIASHYTNFSNLFFRMNLFLFGRTQEEGAQTLLHLSLDDDGANVSGKFWSECKTCPVIKGCNTENNRLLVKTTREILGIASDNRY